MGYIYNNALQASMCSEFFYDKYKNVQCTFFKVSILKVIIHIQEAVAYIANIGKQINEGYRLIREYASCLDLPHNHYDPLVVRN